LQAVASDHLPHPPRHKQCEFETAESGSIGFELAFSATLAALGDLDAVGHALCSGPRRILGRPAPSLMVGALADLVLVAPNEEWTLAKANIQSSENNTPMLGASLTGRVKMTWVSGGLAFDACVNRKM